MSRHTDARVRERELGLLRLRRVTRSVVAVAVGGCAAFAGIAAVSKSTAATTNAGGSKVIVNGTIANKKATAAPPTVAAPATAPTFAPSPPVTASGGS